MTQLHTITYVVTLMTTWPFNRGGAQTHDSAVGRVADEVYSSDYNGNTGSGGGAAYSVLGRGRSRLGVRALWHPGMMLRDCVVTYHITHTLPFSPTHLYLYDSKRQRPQPIKEQTGREANWMK
jgi:hypothetical protein